MQTKEKENQTAHSRVLKFRAWNKCLKCMSEVLELDFQHDAIRCVPGHLPKNRISDCEVMQFTGLLDKNGKEVFEGDIVKCLDGYNAEVFWDDKHTGWHPFGSYEGAEWDKSVEIIGNIYENSDLLNP